MKLEDLIGTSLGPYRFDALLGEGGFATVYRGYQIALERPVALKVLDPRLARIPQFIERFRREAEATFSLRHPNIVEVYDFRELGGLWVIVMEYVDGPTLRILLKDKGAYYIRSGETEATRLNEEALDDMTVLRNLTRAYQPLDCGTVAEVGRQVCAALEHAHNRNVIHRDLKPDNVLLSSTGTVKLGDFGIARVQEDTRLTRTGLRIGSVAYMSPEQILGREVDARSDVYALGVTLYELLTGTAPFVGHETAVWQMHLRQSPERPSFLRNNIPTALEQVVLRCLEKDPEARYPTAAEAGQALASATRPTPLITLFSGETPARNLQTAVAGDTASWVCPECGSGFSSVEEVAACPGCDRMVAKKQAEAEQGRRLRAAEELIAGLKLATHLSLEVRAYEYERSIRPELQKQLDAGLEAWCKALARGSVISPASEPENRPDAAGVLAAARAVHESAALLESRTVDAFVVTLEAKATRREEVTELLARAQMLLGLYHSILGAGSQDAAAMTVSYRRAWACHEAARVRFGRENEISRGAAAAERLAGAVLGHPSGSEGKAQWEELEATLASLASTLPGAAADLAMVRDYLATPEQDRIAAARKQTVAGLQAGWQALAARDEQLRALAAEEAQALPRHEQRRSEAERKHATRARQLRSNQRRVLIPAVMLPVTLLILWAVLMRYVASSEEQFRPLGSIELISLLAVGLASLSGFLYGMSGQKYDWEHLPGAGCLSIASGVIGGIAAIVGAVQSDYAGLVLGFAGFFVEVGIGNRVHSNTEQLRAHAAASKSLLEEADADLQRERAEFSARRSQVEAVAEAAGSAALQACRRAVTIMQVEAKRWSARLLCQRSPAELVDIGEWEVELSKLQAHLLLLKPGLAPSGAASWPELSNQGVDGMARPLPQPSAGTQPASSPLVGQLPAPASHEQRKHQPFHSSAQKVLAEAESGGVELTGGWTIPGQGLLGFSGDCQLDARVLMTGQDLDRASIVQVTAAYFRECGYVVHMMPKDDLQLKRGSQAGKLLGFGIKGFPTSITVMVRGVQRGAFEVHLSGAISTEGAIASSVSLLQAELQGYVARLDDWHRKQCNGR